MPDPNYMSGQEDITWTMREALVDWLFELHLALYMHPETLWIAVNIFDRFLAKRPVFRTKLQLTGAIAMFIAAKFAEADVQCVNDFMFRMTDEYSKSDIINGERIFLRTLDFELSHYCSPYIWMRMISKADNSGIQMWTLSKFLMEVTLLDHRFLSFPPSLVAAVGMYTAKKLLGSEWVSSALVGVYL